MEIPQMILAIFPQPLASTLQVASGLLVPCLLSGVEMLGRSFCPIAFDLFTRKTRTKEIKQLEEIMMGVHDKSSWVSPNFLSTPFH